MKKLKVLAFSIFTAFAIDVATVNIAFAEPKPSKTVTVKKNTTVKKKAPTRKRVKKKNNQKFRASVESPERVLLAQRGKCFEEAGDDAHLYFMCEQKFPLKYEAPTIVASSVSNSQKDSSSVYGGLFSSSSSSKPKIINEASRMEGKNARKDREQIKSYLKSASNKNEPVDPARIPWCAAFANAVLRRVGYEGTESLMARSFLHYGVKTKDPVEGDIVVLRRGRSSVTGHVGFFNGYEWYGSELYVKVLGGNQNKEVNVAYFPANLVLGYRRPV